MDNIADLGIYQMLAAYVFIVILLIIVRVKKIAREKEIILSSLRMTLQLIIAGNVLAYIFNSMNIFYTLVVILVMEAFAIFNTFRRVNKKISNSLKMVVICSILIGTLSNLIYFVFVVIRNTPWYEPRYLIPIAGMLIGNSMTGISLGLSDLINGMESERDKIEGALVLGATPKMATEDIVRKSFDNAILPTTLSMVGIGIVFLPGMMTGQILSGISPYIAIKYQIIIMLGILGSVSFTVLILIQFGYRTFFNKEKQLID